MTTVNVNFSFDANGTRQLVAPQIRGLNVMEKVSSTLPPTVTLVSSPLGQRLVPFVIDVTDVEGFREIIISAKFPRQRTHEVVYDGSFADNYSLANNRRDNITGGYRFTILRDGGWPVGELAELRFRAFDVDGNET